VRHAAREAAFEQLLADRGRDAHGHLRGGMRAHPPGARGARPLPL